MKKVLITTTIITAIWGIVDNNIIPILANLSIIILVDLFNN